MENEIFTEYQITENDKKRYKMLMSLPDNFELTDLDLEFCNAFVGGQFDDERIIGK